MAQSVDTTLAELELLTLWIQMIMLTESLCLYSN